jgi:hypothetical protein
MIAGVTSQERNRVRKLTATIASASQELLSLLDGDDDAVDFDRSDHARRRRPEWRRRGRVFHEISKRGGRVSTLDFIQILLNSGYKDGRGANGFFRGDPLPVLRNEADEVVLTERGERAARFYEAYWLPQETVEA